MFCQAEIRDEWMDNIDWEKIKEKEGNQKEVDMEDSDEEEKVDLCSIYK